ncbi:MAG: hypothetical protein ABWY00_10200 [Dongiaceae bacterium]
MEQAALAPRNLTAGYICSSFMRHRRPQSSSKVARQCRANRIGFSMPKDHAALNETHARWLIRVGAVDAGLLGDLMPEQATTPELIARAKDLYKVPKDKAKAAKFQVLLLANLNRLEIDAEPLKAAIRGIGWLHETDRLSCLTATVKTVGNWNGEDRPGLLAAVTDEVKYLAPSEGDYREPTDDQIAALQNILQAVPSHIEPAAQRAVLLGIAEALDTVCLGADWFTFDGDGLEDAIAYAVNKITESENAGEADGIAEQLKAILETADALVAAMPGDFKTASALLAASRSGALDDPAADAPVSAAS